MTTRAPVLFLQHDKAVAVPPEEWTPFPWMRIHNIEDFSKWTNSKNAVTTVAAASNGATLPTGTINLTDASKFTPQGYAGFETDTGVETIVRYTNRDATRLLGCTLGTGTLATGDVARQVIVDLTLPSGAISCFIAEHAWPNVVAGGTALTRIRSSSMPFELEAGSGPGAVLSDLWDETNAPARSIAIEQPGAVAAVLAGADTNKYRVEVWQNSAATINTLFKLASLGYPRIVAIAPVPFSS